MSKNENENEELLEEERKKLKDLGVNSTWGILTAGEKKKKKDEEEDKPEFRGFK